MRTNIDINDDLMAAAMQAGNFKTKREAVEEGLRLLKRQKAYAALLAARGTLFWDDSDDAWAKVQAQHQRLETTVQDSPTPYAVKPKVKGQKSKTGQSRATTGARRTSP